MSNFVIPGSKLDLLKQSRKEGVSVSGWQGLDIEGAAPLRAIWLDENDTQIGAELELGPIQFTLTEGFFPDGSIGAEPVAREIPFEFAAPGGAQNLQLLWGDERLTVAAEELARPQSMPGDPVVRNFPDDDRGFFYPVFSDGFLDAEAFFACVRDLTNWIRAQPPFDNPQLATRFGMKAYFWPAPAAGVSHFGAPLTGPMICTVGGGSPVLLGSQEDSARLVGALTNEGQGLILMNSSQRGGAGGSAPHRYPAWASISGCPGEDWRTIALHEIGHSLGLEDEYVLPDLPDYAQWRNAPFTAGANATSKKDPDRAPWRDMLNLGGDTDQPTVALDEQNAGWVDPMPGGKPLIGTIAGAHYHEKYFRPSGDCLMRNLSAPRFCAVCQKHIIAKLR